MERARVLSTRRSKPATPATWWTSCELFSPRPSDGDGFHGPEQWEDDLRRQTVLERLGWRFWRVRGSVYYRDPEAAMANLWPLLDELGIHPGEDDAPEPPAPATAPPQPM
ncbi:hypothetical protein [Actinomadura alba]|uniref:Restriction endonuclease type II-like domain-containing protein n=1 Tax=Actinomadura alba TaxID=406431 RepID=A0ABR7LVM8_9ACTN|nr:hypothetical protein [Actinomadura alba]